MEIHTLLNFKVPKMHRVFRITFVLLLACRGRPFTGGGQVTSLKNLGNMHTTFLRVLSVLIADRIVFKNV